MGCTEVPFTVVYDACVLYPSITRDLLIRVAIEGMVQARWSEQILDETFRNLKTNRPDLDPNRLDRTRALMTASLPAAMTSGHEGLIDALELPDPDDRHVLAVAIQAGAQLIVTDNLTDFPPSALTPFNVEARGADDFLVDQIHINAGIIRRILRDIAATRRGQPTDDVILEHMESTGLIQSVALLRAAQ